MSVKALDWAWDQRPETTVQKFMLVLLAERHNRDTGRCDASVSRLADDLMVHARSARRLLQQLEDQGFIEIQARYHKGQQRTNQYALKMDRKRDDVTEGSGQGDTGSPLTAETGVTESDPLGVTEDAPLGVTESGPEPEVEPEVEPEALLVLGEKPPDPPEQFLRWWQAYPRDRRRDRKAALTAWMKLKPQEREAAFRDVVELQRGTRDEKWARGYSKEPHRYLQQKLWTEEWQEATHATRERGDGGSGVRGDPLRRVLEANRQRFGPGDGE